MIKLELYKIFRRKLVWIVLIGIFVLICHSCIMDLKRNYFNDERHKYLEKDIELFEKHKGVLTDERISEFCKEYAHSKKWVYYMEYFFENGDINGGKQIPISKIYKDIDFDINFGYFMGPWGIGSNLSNVAKYMVVFVIIVFSSIFTYEKECGVHELLLSTRKGRKECTKAKVLLAFLITNILYFLFIIIPVAAELLVSNGKGFDTSIQFPHIQRHMLVNLNYGEYLLHAVFISIIVINFILLITLSASFLLDNPVIVMCIGFVISFLIRPDIMATHVNNKVLDIITALLPFNVVYIENLCKQIPFVIGETKIHWLYVAEIIYSIFLILGIIFFMEKLIKNQKYYAS